MKVIFLDIDGVLNFDTTEARTPSGYLGVADCCVRRLRKIVQATGAYIVLSSDWKDGWNFNEEKCNLDVKYLIKKLDRQGLHIIDKTPDIDHYKRGTEILDWLKRHDTVTNYVVLDDKLFDYYDSDIIKHHVMTTNLYGLTDKDINTAVNILMED